MVEQAPTIDQKTIEELAEHVLFKGGTLAEIRGLSEEDLEAVYSIAYNLYGQGRHDEADPLFRFLCFYDHTQKRFWMGLAACRQMLKQYEGAVQAYSVAALLDVDDPMPPFYAAECHLALGKLEEAESGFTAAIHWAGDDPRHAAVRQRAEGMLALLGQRKKKEANR